MLVMATEAGFEYKYQYQPEAREQEHNGYEAGYEDEEASAHGDEEEEEEEQYDEEQQENPQSSQPDEASADESSIETPPQCDENYLSLRCLSSPVCAFLPTCPVATPPLQSN